MDIKGIIAGLTAAVRRRIRWWRQRRVARTATNTNLGNLPGHNLLVLCYGNIYRSPFVAAKLKSLLESTRWKIKSAGFILKENRPCSEEFIALAKDFDIDLSAHRSKIVSDEDLNWATLVVIMDCFNRDCLYDFRAETSNKIIWLGAIDDIGKVEIDDPFGRKADEVREIAVCLNNASEMLARKLKESTPEPGRAFSKSGSAIR